MKSFNPLDRGNLNQMRKLGIMLSVTSGTQCFNPLDRGNLNQMQNTEPCGHGMLLRFQSPRSGKFESNFIGSDL